MPRKYILVTGNIGCGRRTYMEVLKEQDVTDISGYQAQGFVTSIQFNANTLFRGGQPHLGETVVELDCLHEDAIRLRNLDSRLQRTCMNRAAAFIHVIDPCNHTCFEDLSARLNYLIRYTQTSGKKIYFFINRNDHYNSFDTPSRDSYNQNIQLLTRVCNNMGYQPIIEANPREVMGKSGIVTSMQTIVDDIAPPEPPPPPRVIVLNPSHSGRTLHRHNSHNQLRYLNQLL